MKNKNILCICIIMILCITTNKLFSQSTILGNTQVANTNFLGWDAASTNDLNIRHDSTQNIDFWTNHIQRMMIAGAVGTNPGYVGINTTAPAERLHINDTTTVYTRYTVNNSTGNFFRVGGDSQGDGLFHCKATGSYMGFLSNTSEVARMWGSTDHWAFGASTSGSYTGGVGPQSLVSLNQYGDSAVWLQWSTFYSSAPFTGTTTTDGLRIGIRATNPIAEFRQNENQPMAFYTNYGSNTAGSLTIDSNKFVGVGNFVNPSQTWAPWRRMEVMDTDTTPQFRITNSHNNSSVTSGTWTDMRATAAGNLKVNASNGKVGINLNTLTAYEPQYNLHFAGNTMCSDNVSITNPYGVLNTTGAAPTYYTLAVKTQPVATSLDQSCFGIYSNESTSTDRLSILADTLGYINYWSLARPTIYRERGTLQQNGTDRISYYGTSPDLGGIVMIPNFYETARTAGSTSALASLYPAKLWVESNNSNPNSGGELPPIVANNTVDLAVDNNVEHFGLKSYCTGGQISTSHINRGGYFVAGNSEVNRAIEGIARHNTTGNLENVAGYFLADSAHTNNFGVFASTTSPSPNNYGGHFIANSGTTVNYGVWASTPIPTTATCIPLGACADAAGYFVGDVFTSGGNFITSDATLKTNIDTLSATDANNFLNNINVYSFEYNLANSHGLNLPTGTHYGVLANELEQILPKLTKNLINPEEKDANGAIINPAYPFKAVNYTELIPLLIAGYQKQQQQIDSLIQAMTLCCPLMNPTGNKDTEPANGMTVELENSNAIILDQNDPNPFAENTTIKWNIPEEELKGQALNAMVIFYDNNGTVIKTVKVNTTGEGSLLVYGNKLNSGVYTYSLVVNGKTISTKRMVKTNGQ